jgi:hypothetical protein
MLRHDALEAELAGVLEDGRSIPVEVLVELDALIGDPLQEMLEPAFPRFQKVRPEIDATQFQQVEGVQEHPVVVGSAVEPLEVGHPVEVAADRLTVQDQGARPKARHCLSDEREPVRPVVAPAGEQPDPVVLLPDDQPIAVVLDLVNPVGTDRGLVRPGRDARFDEGGRLPLGGWERHNMGGRWQIGDGRASAEMSLFRNSAPEPSVGRRPKFEHGDPPGLWFDNADCHG